MKLSIICFSMTGFVTAKKLKTGLEKQGHDVSLAAKSKYLEDSIKESVGEWSKDRFTRDDGIVFVGACGIAVRSIAPYVASKKSDPAVLVIDECGRFVISLLSGHLGGANDLAALCSRILDAQPVITTATDLHSRFAVDVFAKKNHCEIHNMKAAKEVSAALLAGETVGFYSEFPYKGKLPDGLTVCDLSGKKRNIEDKNMADFCQDQASDIPQIGIAVTIHKNCVPFASTVQVIPKILTIGMGCRKNKDMEEIKKAAEKCFVEAGVFPQAAEALASISIKKEEPGLIAFAKEKNLPFITYEGEELMEVSGDFTPSPFVKKITGADNVCERSAVRFSDNGELIKRKISENGVTAALAVRKWEVRFE